MWLNLRLVITPLVWCFLITTLNAQNPLFRSVECGEHDEETVDITFRLPVASSLDSAGVIAFDDADQSFLDGSSDSWKSWSYVENFAFGKDRGDMPMIADITALHPYFRDQILELVRLCRKKGIELAIVESYRTHAKQHEYKTMGKKYTNSGAGRSKHQYGLAIDVVPMVNGIAIWDNTLLWRKVGVVGEKLGLRWGGRWRKPYDPGHFEWTGGISSGVLTSGTFPAVPKAEERYPCLEEDLKLLQVYWKEWETSQSAFTRK